MGARGRWGGARTYLVGAGGAVFVLLDAALAGLRAGGRVDFGSLDDLGIALVAVVVAIRARHGPLVIGWSENMDSWFIFKRV